MARKSVMEQRQERCQLISEEFAENEKKIRELREKEIETNKEKKKFIYVPWDFIPGPVG